MKEDYKILKQVSLFQGILAEEHKPILDCLGAVEKTYTKNQAIILAGDEITSLGIIIIGSVQVIREDIIGNRMIVAKLEEGEIFGETLASAGVEASPVSVFASEPCKIIWILIQRIVTPCNNVCEFHSSLLTNLLKLLARKNIYLNNKMELLSKRTIREKIMGYLDLQMEGKNSKSIEIPLNRNDLADYLCIDRSAMSRELSKLKEEGIIDYYKNYFKIL
jgi:CRP-like cAMP-binding protein